MKLKLNRARCLLIGICILTLMFQTGCRIKDEIEDLSIYVGLGLDEANKTELETKVDKLGTGETPKNLITFTVQIVDKQSEGKVGDKGSDPAAKSYKNITETGDSLFQLIREFSSQLERPLIGHHLKVIVINEQLSRHFSMHQLLDFFLRDNDIRPSSMVLMSSGSARKTLEAKGKSIIPSFRLMGMIDNRYRTLKIIPPMTLSTLQGKMHAKSSYLLQNVIAADGEVKFSGAAVIKGKTQKFRGLLSEEELLGITWLSGKGEGGLVKSYDEKTKQIITYEVLKMESKIRSHVDGDHIAFDVDIQSEGRLIEDWTSSSGPIVAEFKERAEQAAEKEVKRLIKLGLDKIQKKYKTDVVGFGTRLNIEHPKQWQKVKQDWDNVFSQVPITYKVKLNITDMGAKKSH